MKNLILFFTVILMSFSLCSNSCSNQSQDDDVGKFLTEELILNEVKKGKSDISKDDICIDEIKSFKTLFIVGFFAHDRGCGDSKYYYKGHSIELNDEHIQTILIDNGFSNNKTATVEAFHSKVINHLNYVQNTRPESFDKTSYDFHAPKTWEENGQIISAIWVKRPGGMMPEDRFALSIYIVDKDGKVISHSKKNKFTVPFN